MTDLLILAQRGGGAPIAGLLCGGMIGLTVATLIGALVLRFGFTIHNYFCAESNRVDEPDFGNAAAMMLIATLCNLVVGFMIGFVIGMIFGDSQETRIIAQLISFPAGLLAMTTVLTVMVPTTFTRAMLLTLGYLAAALCVGLVIGLIVFVVVMAMGGLG